MISKIELVIFDLDGVLINSKNNMRFAWNAVLKKFRLNINFNEYFKYIGIPFEDILTKFRVNVKYHKIIKETFSKASLNNIGQIKLYPNVIKTINLLKENKIKLAIVTSKDKIRSKRIIKRLKINITQICSPEKKLRGKPYPDQLIKTLTINDIKAKNAIYIGDTKFDFIAAKRAGIKFIFANYGYGKNTPLYKYKINKVKDILNLI